MFHFSLQTVLEVRERQERIKYKEYSQALMQQQSLEHRIRDRHGDLSRAARFSDRVRAEGGTTVPLQFHNQFRQRVQGEIERLREQLREHSQHLEAKRLELVEARRAHRAMEILREREWARYQREQLRQERVLMDEIASNYHVHQQ